MFHHSYITKVAKQTMWVWLDHLTISLVVSCMPSSREALFSTTATPPRVA